MHEKEIFDFQIAPRPKMNVEIGKLRRPGELERYVQYAARDDGDGVLIALDCEDFCPVKIAREFCHRIASLGVAKRVGTVLFRSEYESMFLFSIAEIAAAYPEFGWNVAREKLPPDPEELRNAKGFLSRLMSNGRAYKETRDQARFSHVMNLERVRRYSRSFRHLESTLSWMRSPAPAAADVHPFIR
jgi:hypothetical protein